MNEQYHPETTKKRKVRLPLSAYLSYLLIATLLVTGVSFSKFASSGSAEDGARVALVMVDGGSSNGSDTNLSLGDGVTSDKYEFFISNYIDAVSEVSLNYTITVTMPDGKALPEGVAVTLAYTSLSAADLNGTPKAEVYEGVPCELVSSEAEIESGVYTFEGGAIFDAGRYTWQEHYYALTFTVTDESLITEDSSFTGIEISVKAEQID